MRIAYVITRSDNVGGAQHHVLHLASEFLRQGHEVTVLAGGRGPFVEELAACGVPRVSLEHLVRPIHPARDALALAELRAALRRLHPDIVCAHSSKAGWLGRLAGRTIGVPTVFTAHGWVFAGPRSAGGRSGGRAGRPAGQRLASIAYILAEQVAALMADRIITVSDYDRELALRCRVAPARKVVTIHNGVPDVAPELRADPAGQPPRLIMVARFEPQKDHATLVRALAGLRELEWSLDLVGDGPLRPEIERLAQSLGLGGRVRFLGTRRDVAELLAKAQVFVLASNMEGLPLSILEAMRAGLPVIATDVGGVSEAVAKSSTGYLVARGDAAGLLGRLGELIRTPSLRESMGEAGRHLYDATFTLRSMSERTLELYRSLVAEGSSRGGYPCRHRHLVPGDPVEESTGGCPPRASPLF